MRINTPEVMVLVSRAFPEFRGKRVSVEVFSGPMTMNSYWDGGSRDYWAVLNMGTGAIGHVPENGTPWNPSIAPLPDLPVNCAVVCWSRSSCESVTVYVRAENLNSLMLADKTELEWAEKVVLSATRSLKSSYGGVSNYRFHAASERTGITLAEWDTAKASLVGKGMLNKAGAISNDGRNAIGNTDFYYLKRTAELVAV